jgi:hypothetical protein
MNYAEEELLLNFELGKAIAQWGYVEGHLLNVVKQCSLQNGNAVAAAYLSIENFRSKLAFCDNLVKSIFQKKYALEYWARVHDRCSSLSSRRNQLAHGWHALYVHGPSGKRFGITPVLAVDGQLVHREGIEPPTGTLFLRDIVRCRMEFDALTRQVCNVHQLLCGRRKPFPEADEPLQGAAPTIRQLENNLRVRLGRKPRPSRSRNTDPHVVTPPTAEPSSDS